MKKIIALAIAVLMLATLAVPAFAANLDANTTSGNTVVEYEVTGAYTVTIPEKVVLGNSAEVTVAGMIGVGEELTVSVDSTQAAESKWYVKNGDVAIEYSIKDGETAVTPRAAIITWKAGSKTLTKTLAFAVVGTATQTGTYTDSLTFTVDVQ